MSPNELILAGQGIGGDIADAQKGEKLAQASPLSEDEEEAFNDLEDETMLCADYVPQTRNKRLPDAIIIGARKVQIIFFLTSIHRV